MLFENSKQLSGEFKLNAKEIVKQKPHTIFLNSFRTSQGSFTSYYERIVGEEP